MCICQLTNKEDIDVSVAKEDLTFYKVLNESFGKYFTPFRTKEVKLNVWYRELIDTFYTNGVHRVNYLSPSKLDKYFISKDIDIVPVINGRAIHLFKTKEGAEKYISFADSDEEKLFIVKAIVPKGTEYIDGMFLCNTTNTVAAFPSIATKRVIYRDLNYKGWFNELLKKLKLRK